MFQIARKLPAVVLVAVLSLTLGVISLGAQEDTSFRVGINAPVNLDPALGTNDSEILFNRQIYDYLIDIAPNGSLVGNLATDWETSEDGLTYTISLREDVTFHDGTPFSAADVVFTFERLQEVGSPALNLLGDYTVIPTDDNTVTFTLEAPNADFLFGVASRWSFILMDGMDAPNTLGEGDDAFANFVGTGPFVLSSYNVGENATFTANPDYWMEDAPVSDIVELIFIEEQQAQVDALRSGTVDMIFKLGFERVAELEPEEDLSVVIKSTNLHPVIRLRADEGFLGADERVREAFKFATDRELLNIDLFDGLAAVGNNDPIGPVFGLFYDDSIPDRGYDPEQACALLEEAGFPDGLGADDPLEFYVVDAFNYEDMAINLQAQWEEACINVEILMRPENIYYGNNEWLDVELGVTGWGSRPIPQQYLLEAYITDALPENGGFNESRFSDPELDELVAQASVTSDIEDRAAIYSQIAQIFYDRGPIIVPFFTPLVGATGADVTGVDLHPFAGRTDLRMANVGS